MSKRTSIRIPDDLYALLVERAKKEQRTVSNLIVALLTQSTKGSKIGPNRDEGEGV